MTTSVPGDTEPGRSDVPASPELSPAALADRRLATAELVLDIAAAAAGTLELDDILHAALDRLRGVVAFTGGSIALVHGDELVIRAAVGPFVDEAIGQRLARGTGRSWRVVERLEPVLITDFRGSDVTPAGAAARVGMRSWLAVPIPRRGEGIGLLEVDSTLPDAFGEDDVSLLRTVAAALAGPIDLAARIAAERLHRELRDAFTGVVSHELRTPITTIYGMSHVLRARHAELGTAERAALIADIEAEADRLRRMVEDLLILSRVEGGLLELDVEPLALGRLVRRVVASEAERWPGHGLEVTIADDLPVAVGDPVSVEQVVRNLVSNAAKYSPSGGRVEVQVSGEEGWVTVRVLDEGLGLPDVPTNRLFELYFRAPEATRHAPGAGIGLFVCRALVEAMRGRMWARARDGGGSEFGFGLPIDPDAAPEPTAGGDAPGSAAPA